MVNIIGDFNAQVSANDNFNFVNYPHIVNYPHNCNKNGTLLMNFASTNSLFCLNPMSCNGKASEDYTFQRDLGMY